MTTDTEQSHTLRHTAEEHTQREDVRTTAYRLHDWRASVHDRRWRDSDSHAVKRCV